VIRFEAVSRRFNSVIAVDRLTLEVRSGELMVLIGPSGCGKTTTLKMVNRLVDPTSGSIHIDNIQIADLDPVALRQRIGYVIQEIGLFPHMRVAANIAVVPRVLGWSRARVDARVDELLALFGMERSQFRDRYPAELSGGQQQRVGVMRALAADPGIVLMDEPFGSLDAVTREQLQGELRQLQSKLHKTIIVVTHDLDEALKLGDRIAVMRAGKLVQVGTGDELMLTPVDPFVREFVSVKRALRSPDKLSVRHVMSQPQTIRLGHADGEFRTLPPGPVWVIDAEERPCGILEIGSRDRAGAVGDPPPQMRKVKHQLDEHASMKDAVQLAAAEAHEPIAITDAQGRLIGEVGVQAICAFLRRTWG
jgi:osmoprotectant transport system ATP-binding protein